MFYYILFVALTLEVFGTSLLKFSEGFKHITFGCAAYVAYGVSIYLFSFALEHIKLAIADTLWQGLGIVMICLVSAFVFDESISLLQYVFIAVTMLGVIGLGLVS